MIRFNRGDQIALAGAVLSFKLAKWRGLLVYFAGLTIGAIEGLNNAKQTGWTALE